MSINGANATDAAHSSLFGKDSENACRKKRETGPCTGISFRQERGKISLYFSFSMANTLWGT